MSEHCHDKVITLGSSCLPIRFLNLRAYYFSQHRLFGLLCLRQIRNK